jgi:GNAT superfamily N-acetyltransferase
MSRESDATPGGHRIRAIDPSSPAEVDLVAVRMRQTLIEVLGEERGRAFYTMAWLRRRVLWHLNPDKSTAQVFLSENSAGHVTGHTIVRVERDDDGREIGLFSTFFVEPESRRTAVATSLLRRGEEWMRQHGMTEAVTYTSDSNVKLINLLGKHGYKIVDSGSEMVRLAKPLQSLEE